LSVLIAYEKQKSVKTNNLWIYKKKEKYNWEKLVCEKKGTKTCSSESIFRYICFIIK